MSIADEIGPVEYMIIEFPGNRFSGEIIPALAELVEQEMIHILDLIVIHKDEAGDVTYFEYDALEEAEAALFGSLEFDVEGVLSDEDILHEASLMENNSTAALLVWEIPWAAKFAKAVRNAHGRIIANERVPHAVVEAALEYADHVLAEAGVTPE